MAGELFLLGFVGLNCPPVRGRRVSREASRRHWGPISFASATELLLNSKDRFFFFEVKLKGTHVGIENHVVLPIPVYEIFVFDGKNRIVVRLVTGSSRGAEVCRRRDGSCRRGDRMYDTRTRINKALIPTPMSSKREAILPSNHHIRRQFGHSQSRGSCFRYRRIQATRKANNSNASRLTLETK